MNQQSFDIPLHDIKTVIDIEEYSFYYLSVVVVLVSIVLLGALYLLVKYLKNRNTFNIRKEHSRLLHEIRFENPKEDAYNITRWGDTFKNDSERHRNAYETLVKSLEAYKYKKDVGTFDENVKHAFDIYLGMIDV